MASASEVRQAVKGTSFRFSDEEVARLAKGETIALTDKHLAAGAGDCCPAGSIGIGHKPRWCFTVKPFGVSICDG